MQVIAPKTMFLGGKDGNSMGGLSYPKLHIVIAVPKPIHLCAKTNYRYKL